MIVCVSVREELCRSVFVRVPEGRSSDDAVKLVKDKYNAGDIVLDADDFVCHSGEVAESYTELEDRFVGRIDYELE